MATHNRGKKPHHFKNCTKTAQKLRGNWVKRQNVVSFGVQQIRDQKQRPKTANGQSYRRAICNTETAISSDTIGFYRNKWWKKTEMGSFFSSWLFWLIGGRKPRCQAILSVNNLQHSTALSWRMVITEAVQRNAAGACFVKEWAVTVVAFWDGAYKLFLCYCLTIIASAYQRLAIAYAGSVMVVTRQRKL